MNPLMIGTSSPLRASLLLAFAIAAGCGDDGTSGPPMPSRESRLETARKIDETRGFEVFTIGKHLDKVVNVGKPDSYVYIDGGVKLAVFRKTSTKVKVGDVAFTKVSLFFGRTEEMQMYQLSEPASRADCDTAAAKFTDLWGEGTPKGWNKKVWVGHEIQATWEHATVRGTPTCYIEVRAVHPR